MSFAMASFFRPLSMKNTKDENRTDTTTAISKGQNSDGISLTKKSDKKPTLTNDISIANASEVIPFSAPDSPGDAGDDIMNNDLNLMNVSVDAQAAHEESLMTPADECTRNDGLNISRESFTNQNDLTEDDDARFELLLAG